MKTFLFDLDGTLIDSVGLILASYRHTMTTHFGAPYPDARWTRGLGTPLMLQLEEFATPEHPTQSLAKTYRDYTLAHHDDFVRVFDQIPQVLRALQPMGPMGIVSGKRRVGVERGLRTCELTDFFEVIVGADDHEDHKPNPGPIEFALSQLGARPEDAVYIGDAPSDLEAGRRAGVLTAAALWGPFDRAQLADYAPDVWLEHPQQIMALAETAR